VAYATQTWVDNDAVNYPVSAARMNYIEAGIAAAPVKAPAAVADNTITVVGDFPGVRIKSQAAAGNSAFDVGPGTAYGAPPSAPTLVSGGAGALTGVYQYAYTELDFYGETTPSPLASITLAAERAQVTLPHARRGISKRRLYRTVAGGAQLKVVSDLASDGSGFHQTIFTDNLVDGSLGANAPASDTTQLYNIHIRDSVKYLRTGPAQGTTAADLTLLTADANGNGTLALDAYGQILTRARSAHNYRAEHTGTGGGFRSYSATFIDSAARDAQTAPIPKEVFWVDPDGQLVVKPSGAGSTPAISVRTDGETGDRLRIRADGQVFFGDGAGSMDAKGPYRWATNIIAFDTTLDLLEQAVDPSAPSANRGRLYLRDNGSGKTQLCVRFNTGAIQVLATEP
jgi:hypothetical protein